MIVLTGHRDMDHLSKLLCSITTDESGNREVIQEKGGTKHEELYG